MSINQLHGKKFENIIAESFDVDQEMKANAKNDIPFQYDRVKNLDTSVKTKKKTKKGNEVIEAADARTFFSKFKPERLCLGLYEQSGLIKKFDTIHEYIITSEDLNKLKGNYDNESMLKDVTFIHNKIRDAQLPPSQSAKQEVRQLINKFKEDYPLCKIKLNPKWHTKTKGRLQCSIPKLELENIVTDKRKFTNEYRGIELPIIIISTEREFN